MTAALENPSSSRSPHPSFHSTLWTQVHLAGAPNNPESTRALEKLCSLYWPPIHAFLRRSGFDPETARDLTQAFFGYAISADLLHKADPARGRFRSYLLGCLKLFVSNQKAREAAVKRGGRAILVPLDLDGAHWEEPASHLTPDRAFERKWALAVLAEAMRRLESEYARAGMEMEMNDLKPFLTGETVEKLPALAERLGKSPGATRVSVCRLRNRFRRLVRDVIAETLTDSAQVEAELLALQAALRET